MKKIKIIPLERYAEPTDENLEQFNAIRTLYRAYSTSDLQPDSYVAQFFDSVGLILKGVPLQEIPLRHFTFEDYE